MFVLLAYAWTSAVVTGLLGTLPGRTFPFRVSLVAIVLSLGAVLSFSVAHFWVDSLFDGDRLPGGVTPGNWAMLGLYAVALTQVMGFLILLPKPIRIGRDKGDAVCLWRPGQ